jgi:predicted metallo-beta-lactamase superfamily hydrolase
MIIKILGTESLGVRGLSCAVKLKNRKIVIDPGIALGWSRHRLLPHPFQVAIGAGIRTKIVEELKTADDVIFSHFHGDHCPLYNPNPYQLGIEAIKDNLSSCRIWAKNANNTPPAQQKRREKLIEILAKDLQNAEGKITGPVTFSSAVPHGKHGGTMNRVMMSRIEEDGITFVHASDIQLLDTETIESILDWKPDIVLASGPPLYQFSSTSFQEHTKNAWHNAQLLSDNVKTLIIDHHLLRSEEGISWLEKLKNRAQNRIYCAADFMRKTPLFLEAWRRELYNWLPVSHDWHEQYGQGEVDFTSYRIRGWEVLIDSGKITPCKWYYGCPIKAYTDAGKLNRYWIEEYCLVNNKNCLRFKMEETGQYHPDNMLPDGEIREDL